MDPAVVGRDKDVPSVCAVDGRDMKLLDIVSERSSELSSVVAFSNADASIKLVSNDIDAPTADIPDGRAHDRRRG